MIVFDAPEAYENVSNGIQVVEITELIDEFIDKINNKKGKYLDIGCGPGNHSRQIILPKLPPDSILVGVDISKNMIEKAQNQNADEKRMIFKELNIETTDLPKEHIDAYNGGTSFFCMHWVQDLRLSFENMYKMLRPGGTVLNQIIVSVSFFPAYMKLAENPRYKDYMKDYLKFITPLYFEKNRKAALEKLLREVGFEVLHCRTRARLAKYRNPKERRDLLRVINPFVQRMPKNMQEEFMDDVIRETCKQDSVYMNYSDSFSKEKNAFDLYTFLIVLFKKPGN